MGQPTDIRKTIEKLREAEAQATPGPWTLAEGQVRGKDGESILLCKNRLDATLAAECRNDIVALLDFAEQSLALAEKAHALVVSSESSFSDRAVELRWVLKRLGVLDDSGEPCFSD